MPTGLLVATVAEHGPIHRPWPHNGKLTATNLDNFQVAISARETQLHVTERV